MFIGVFYFIILKNVYFLTYEQCCRIFFFENPFFLYFFQHCVRICTDFFPSWNEAFIFSALAAKSTDCIDKCLNPPLVKSTEIALVLVAARRSKAPFGRMMFKKTDS